MRYQPKKTLADPAMILARRRSEILSEYRFHQLDPIRIGGEPISMELALLLGLLIDNAADPDLLNSRATGAQQHPTDAYQGVE